MISYVINWNELEKMLDKLFGGLLVRDKSTLTGTPSVLGATLNVPALEGEYTVKTWVIDSSCILQGVTYSQSGWKGEDKWLLKLNDEILFSVYTKELGERKSFQNIMTLKQGDKLSIIHQNASGTSKQCWADIELLYTGGNK